MIFREEVYKNKRLSTYGDIELHSEKLINSSSVIVMSIFVLIFSLIFTCNYISKARVNGIVMPKGGVVKILSKKEGYISRVLFENNDYIKKGQPIFELDNSSHTQNYGNIQENIKSRLLNKKQQLIEKSNSIELSYYNEKENLKRNIQIKTKILNNLEKRRKILEKQFHDTKIYLKKLKYALDIKVISFYYFNNENDKFYNLELNLNELNKNIIISNNDINNLKSKLVELPNKLKEDLVTVNMKIEDINSNLINNEFNKSSLVLAPKSGVISTSFANLGQYVRVNDVLTTIIPRSDENMVDLFVPSESMGMLRVGSSTKVRFEAFPYQRYGSVTGEVIKISNNALSPDEIRLLTGVTYPDPMYKVDIRIFGDNYTKLKSEIRSGMAVNAEISKEKHAIYKWIFSPLVLKINNSLKS